MWVLAAALLLGACTTGEDALRLGQSEYLVQAFTLRPARDGAFLKAFQRRALLKAAKVTQGAGRDYFRITGQKRHGYVPAGGAIIGPVSGGMIFVPIPAGPRLPPGEDTERYHLWIELPDGDAEPNPDNLPVYSAPALLAAWPNIGDFVAGLDAVPENNSFVDLGGGDTRRRAGE